MTRIVGPAFQPEIQQIRDIMFKDTACSVLEENVFANRFPNDYRAHVHIFWMDKLRTYFIQNNDWIGTVYKSDEQRGFSSPWFSMYENKRQGVRALKINMAITANRFHETRLAADLHDMFPLFDIVLGLPYYQGNDQFAHVGDRAGGPDEKSGAYQRYLAEFSVNNACLT